MTALFCGCTDVVDNVVEPVIVDPVTEEVYENEGLMDRTVKPGDSFYEFALGSWLKNRDEADEGLLANLAASVSGMLIDAFNYSDDPIVQQLLTAADEVEDTETFVQQLQAILTDLQITGDGDTPPSREHLVEVLAKMVDYGYSPFVSRTLTTAEGRFIRVLTAGDACPKVLEALKSGGEEEAIAVVKEMLGLAYPDETGEDNDHLANAILAIERTVATCAGELYANDLHIRQHATPRRPQKPAQLCARARAAKDGMTAETIIRALGMTGESSLVDDEMQPVVNMLLEEDVETLTAYLAFHVAAQYYDLKPLELDFDDDFGFGGGYFNISNGVKENLYSLLSTKAPEIISRVDYQVLKNYIDPEGCRTMLEQMRTLMDARIAALDWMSDATKSAARSKLAAMEFNVGLPDTQPGSSLTLTGKTLLEDVQQLCAQHQQSTMALAGLPVAGHGWDFYNQFQPLGTVNATYVFELNQLFILPAFISQNLFPRDNEPMRYVTAYVFGHEMCHGFDAKGANYDATGSLRDWWTEADRAEFEKRQLQMVSLYNQLWQYEGVHADGKLTLEENMADLGGMRLAFELYKQKLLADGLSGEALNHGLREYFLHYSLIYQSAPSPDDLEAQLTNDVHSANHNRVIGITRLMDEWYDLFNVADGQWYLPPAERVMIW